MRTRFTPNKIILCDKYAKIILYKREKKGFSQQSKGYFIVDIKDLPKIQNVKWGHAGNGYIANSQHGYLHHKIIPKKKNFVVDHINSNRLDNRKVNLRLVSHSANHLNNCKPGFYYDQKRRKYRIFVMHQYKRHYGGSYTNKQEARIKAKELRIKLLEKELSYVVKDVSEVQEIGL